MGERNWRRGDPVWQRRRLDQVRPDQAAPLSRPIAPPTIDAAFDQGPRAFGFSDLRDVAVPGEPALVQRSSDHDDDHDGERPDDPLRGAPLPTRRPRIEGIERGGFDQTAAADGATERGGGLPHRSTDR
jgi:hypothetical protein